MSEAIPIPPRPDLAHYNSLAEELQQMDASTQPGAFRGWAADWLQKIARQRGARRTRAQRQAIIEEAARLEHRWRSAINPKSKSPWSLKDARQFLAREHGFASWTKFAKHIQALTVPSPIADFEAAVDAIVAGDSKTLSRLLRKNRDLVTVGSTRDHRSTLLHYVSANGIEDYRQTTPANIVAITRKLLQAGADVNAVSNAYGGGSTTLGLVATSAHPASAGVQNKLIQLLLDHGARIGRNAVRGCLANGCGKAAAYLAEHGARLSLDEAAGVGQLSRVQSFFDRDGRLKPGKATPEQFESGFLFACGYGCREVVEYLLATAADARLRNQNGQTGLHWASYGGHAEIVRLLLEHGGQPNAVDDAFQQTPLKWALHMWSGTSSAQQRQRYCNVVSLLVAAGATWDWNQYDMDQHKQSLTKKLQSNRRMLAALRGETKL